MNESCPDFREIFNLITDGLVQEWYDNFIQDGYLFKANKLCIPRTSVRDFIIWELQAGGMSGHVGRYKTISSIVESFFWPHLSWDVANLVDRKSVV